MPAESLCWDTLHMTGREGGREGVPIYIRHTLRHSNGHETKQQGEGVLLITATRRNLLHLNVEGTNGGTSTPCRGLGESGPEE